MLMLNQLDFLAYMSRLLLLFLLRAFIVTLLVTHFLALAASGSLLPFNYGLLDASCGSHRLGLRRFPIFHSHQGYLFYCFIKEIFADCTLIVPQYSSRITG